MNAPLFRPEALQAQQVQWLGSIRIRSSPGRTATAVVAALLLVALLSFSFLAEMTRKVRVPGLIVPVHGVVQILAPQSGTVSELSVTEGHAVHAGQRLALIGLDRSLPSGTLGDRITAALAERRASLMAERRQVETQAVERAASLEARLRNVVVDLKHAQSELAMTDQRERLAARTVDRYRQLLAQGFVSDAGEQQKQEDWLEARARQVAARRTVAALERELLALRAEQASAAMSTASQLAQADRALSSLNQEESESQARAGAALVAQNDSIVAAVNVHPGQAVRAGQSLLTLVPRRRGSSDGMQAQLFAPSRTAGFLHGGQEVWLRLDAYPYQKFGFTRGVIESVSLTPIYVQDLPAQALAQAARRPEPLHRITVGLASQFIMAHGQARPVKPGMSLEADVIQDRRAIWEWVLEPLLSLRGAPRPSYRNGTQTEARS